MKSRTSKIGPAYDKNTDAMCRDSNLIKCDANGCKEVRINEGFVGYCAMQRRRKISSVNDRETTTKRQASKINSLDWFLFIHLFFFSPFPLPGVRCCFFLSELLFSSLFCYVFRKTFWHFLFTSRSVSLSPPGARIHFLFRIHLLSSVCHPSLFPKLLICLLYPASIDEV